MAACTSPPRRTTKTILNHIGIADHHVLGKNFYMKMNIPIAGCALLICSFWLVSGLAIVGERVRARDLMEKLLRIASPLGLYAEEFDVDTGYHLGNFPQAFSHLALIEAASRIIVDEMRDELN